MSRKEVNRITILDRAIKKVITNTEGAKAIGVTPRHFRRIKSRYKKEGAKGVTHRLRGKTGNRLISQAQKDYAIEIVRQKYHDFKPTFAHEKLVEKHGVTFSVETLRKEMIGTEIWKPKRKKRVKVHQMRERRKREGELVQADASPHKWFEDRAPACDLIVFIDDATSKILWMEFVESETTEAYFVATKNYVQIYGKPVSMYVDKHSVFRINTTRKHSTSVTDENGYTQFGRAMKELEIEIIYANSPQAKGRVERVNSTLQDRLIKEMRLRGISNREEGNKYLKDVYIALHNRRFSVIPYDKGNAHRPLLKSINIDEVLAKKYTRIVSKNLTIQHENIVYQIVTTQKSEYVWRKAKVILIVNTSGEVKIRYNNKNVKYKIYKKRPRSKVSTSKDINRDVDIAIKKQPRLYQFNLLGGTFLFWRKGDISNLG